jgi:phenylacetate-CoA ligase
MRVSVTAATIPRDRGERLVAAIKKAGLSTFRREMRAFWPPRRNGEPQVFRVGKWTLHPALVRQVVSPLLERALGRHTYAFLRELREWQWWSPDRLRSLQARKLRTLLLRSRDRCPYYGRVMAEWGVDPNVSDPFGALARMPLLDKPAIRANLADLTDRRVPGGLIRFNTGGSTGDPLVFYVDRRRVGNDKAARMLTHEWFGARPGDPEVYLWGSPVELRAQDRVKRFRDRLVNDMLLEAFNLTPSRMDRYLDRIHAFRPVSLFGYPSSLTRLAEHGLARARRFEHKGLAAVFTTGELLDAHQRQTLESYFGAAVADCYGSRDGGFIAHQCPSGRMHTLDPNIIVEIVDEHGKPVADGASGEIVLTHLDAMAMPLIRYRTGDMGCLSRGACGCGRGLGLLGMMAGRQTDHLVAGDGSLQHGLAAIYCVRDLPSVGRFQIRQGADRGVRVLVTPNPGFTDADRERIRSRMKRQLGRNIEVDVQVVHSIETENSGKFRQVVSDAALGDFARLPV